MGLSEESSGNPWTSAFVGSVSTFIEGIVPLIPFFFFHAIIAMILAAAVSILAQFAVGAAKSLVTARSGWSSGLEMTIAGIIVGVVAYGLGLLGTLVVKM